MVRQVSCEMRFTRARSKPTAPSSQTQMDGPGGLPSRHLPVEQAELRQSRFTDERSHLREVGEVCRPELRSDGRSTCRTWGTSDLQRGHWGPELTRDSSRMEGAHQSPGRTSAGFGECTAGGRNFRAPMGAFPLDASVWTGHALPASRRGRQATWRFDCVSAADSEARERCRLISDCRMESKLRSVLSRFPNFEMTARCRRVNS